MKKSIFSLIALGAVLTGCKNGDIDFPEYDYQTIYFATQTPVRTITLGEENYADNDLDNEHAFMVKATLGGVNENRKDHSATFRIDDSLCEGLLFSDGREIKPLPESYYTITTDRLTIKKGEVVGGFRVDLTDAYFADPASVDVTYVLPVVLTSSNDSILSGKAKDGVINPNRFVNSDWVTSCEPKDYVLYAVTYKNKYHGCWLSQGIDQVNNNGAVSTNERKPGLWENATLRYLKTKSLTRSVYTHEFDVPIILADGSNGETHLVCDLLIDVDGSGNATVSTETPGCTASGSGTWTEHGAKKAWGDADRDDLKLNYKFRIEYVANEATGEKGFYEVSSDEELVMRDRQNKFETFSYTVK